MVGVRVELNFWMIGLCVFFGYFWWVMFMVLCMLSIVWLVLKGILNLVNRMLVFRVLILLSFFILLSECSFVLVGCMIRCLVFFGEMFVSGMVMIMNGKGMFGFVLCGRVRNDNRFVSRVYMKMVRIILDWLMVKLIIFVIGDVF